MTSVLVARLDNDGDVLLSGPAVRAVAAGVQEVTLLCSPRGRQAARLLPGVDRLLVWTCPWIDPDPPPVDSAEVGRLVEEITGRWFDAAVVLTSYHQSPLPTALLLRLAGIPRISAISDDYPGSLLDVRHQPPPDARHEVQRMLSLAGAAGFPPPPGDDARLAVRREWPDTRAATGGDGYVAVHPGASVPARAWSPHRWAQLVDALLAAGRRVVVTGGAGERELTAAVARAPRPGVVDLGGATDFAGMADVLDRAAVLVVGNTGPAHLAATVGTPVVSLFAPTVPAERWRPWGVPQVLLGDQTAACAGSRARVCPVPGHPCLDDTPASAVIAALDALTAGTVPAGSLAEPAVAAVPGPARFFPIPTERDQEGSPMETCR